MQVVKSYTCLVLVKYKLSSLTPVWSWLNASGQVLHLSGLMSVVKSYTCLVLCRLSSLTPVWLNASCQVLHMSGLMQVVKSYTCLVRSGKMQVVKSYTCLVLLKCKLSSLTPVWFRLNASCQVLHLSCLMQVVKSNTCPL